MRGSAFAFPYTQLLCYKIHLYHTSTSPDWIKNKRAKINPSIKNKCFQYAVTVSLNYEEIQKGPQRITKIKSFINKYNLKGINYPSEKNERRKF